MDSGSGATRERLTDIDLAKGLAIFLVVLGHVVAREIPAGNEWYGDLKFALYQFHMPFFMALSGAVFRYTYRRRTSLGAYGRYVLARTQRLAPGFVLFALLIWAGKALGSRFLYVDNLQSGDLASLLQIFSHPSASVATSLWYTYVLLELTIVFPVLLTLLRGRVIGVVVLTAALHVLPYCIELPELIAIDLLCEHALYFALGALFVDHRRACVAAISEHALLFYAVFGLSFLGMLLLPDHGSKTIIGIASLPAVYAFANSFRAQRDRSILLALGEYTFSIYLMNTLAIGVCKGLMFKVLSWDHGNFALYFPVLLSAGVLGPILLHRLVLTRLPFLGGITK